MEKIIITNNDIVKDKFEKEYSMVYVKSLDIMDVMVKMRDYVHNDFRLLTHPLSGSVKPGETPYKSVVMEKGKTLDLNSLNLIENAIELTKKFNMNSRGESYGNKILQDFRVIDYNLICSGIESMVRT